MGQYSDIHCDQQAAKGPLPEPKKGPIVIAVDFDGTLVENKYPEIGDELDPVNIFVLKLLQGIGVKIVLFSSRKEFALASAVEWCLGKGLRVDVINKSCRETAAAYGEERSETPGKVSADVYIDDRILGQPLARSWGITLLGWALNGTVLRFGKLWRSTDKPHPFSGMDEDGKPCPTGKDVNSFYVKTSDIRDEVFSSEVSSLIGEVFSSGAVRDTREDKGRFDLISPHCLRRLAARLEFGAKKYGERNWEKGMPLSRCYDSTLRHLIQWAAGGEDEDHLAAAMFGLMAIQHFESEFVRTHTEKYKNEMDMGPLKNV